VREQQAQLAAREDEQKALKAKLDAAPAAGSPPKVRVRVCSCERAKGAASDAAPPVRHGGCDRRSRDADQRRRAPSAGVSPRMCAHEPLLLLTPCAPLQIQGQGPFSYQWGRAFAGSAFFPIPGAHATCALVRCSPLDTAPDGPAGATSFTYRLTADDVGAVVRVEAKATADPCALTMRCAEHTLIPLHSHGCDDRGRPCGNQHQDT
jgi:hypothetical protein